MRSAQERGEHHTRVEAAAQRDGGGVVEPFGDCVGRQPAQLLRELSRVAGLRRLEAVTPAPVQTLGSGQRKREC